MWIFRNFDLDADLQKFTQKDIIYSNNRNAFVLTDKAKKLSNECNDLVLLCHYQVPKTINMVITYEWKNEYIKLSDLTFDPSTYRVFYFDSDSEFIKRENQLKEKEARKSTASKIEEIERRGANYYHDNVGLIIEMLLDFRVTDIERKELFQEIVVLDPAEIRLLNRSIKDTFSPEKPLWHYLSQNINSNFSNFLHRILLFDIDLEQQYYGTAFQNLLKLNIPAREAGKITVFYLRKGYEFSFSDEEWIKKNITNYQQLSKEEIERLVILKYAWQLKSPDLIDMILPITHVLLPLVSFKIGKVLGSDLANLTAVANNFMEYKKEFAFLLFESLKKNDSEKVLLRESFQKKVKAFKNSPVDANHTYDEVLKIIMLELFRV